MRIFQHPGEDDCCYARWGGKLYEVDEAGWSLVEPEDGAPREVYNEIILDGSKYIWLGHLSGALAQKVIELMRQEEGGR